MIFFFYVIDNAGQQLAVKTVCSALGVCGLFHDITVGTPVKKVQQRAVAVQIKKDVPFLLQICMGRWMGQGGQMTPLVDQVKVFPAFSGFVNDEDTVPGPGLDLVCLK